MRFDTVLAIISMLGFTAIIIEASAGIDVSPLYAAVLFVIMGLALLSSGGYKLFIQYFNEGVTWDELNKIVTVIVGFLSLVLGILLFFGIDIVAFSGVKIIISFIAIFVIALETFFGAKKK